MTTTPRTLCAITASMLLAGCITQPKQLTRAEYLELTQRSFPDHSADQVFGAAEQLFLLADGDDFRFQYTDDSLTASRRWSVYLVIAAAFGTDTWILRRIEGEKGIKYSIQAGRIESAIAPTATSGGDLAASTGPTLAGAIEGTALYTLFWARMDYLLGRSTEWMTCEQAHQMAKQKALWGNLGPLCDSLNTKDLTPEGAPPKAPTPPPGRPG